MDRQRNSDGGECRGAASDHATAFSFPEASATRGIEGKIAAAHYARTNNVPYLGICLGMQIAVIEYARYVCGLSDANSGEFDEDSKHKVIDFMPDQSNEIAKGRNHAPRRISVQNNPRHEDGGML